jgi:hypothetical protein
VRARVCVCTFVCQAIVPIGRIRDGPALEEWLELVARPDKPHKPASGEIRLKLRFDDGVLPAEKGLAARLMGKVTGADKKEESAALLKAAINVCCLFFFFFWFCLN